MADKFDRSNISKTLFSNKDGSCMVFFMRPCSERQNLRPLIEDGGGKITSKLMPGSVKLAEKGSIVTTDDYISTKFITDSVEQNKLVATDKYKVTVGTRVRHESNSDESLIQSFDSRDSMSPAPNAVPVSRELKGRTKYTKEEDVAIISYLIDNRRYAEASGMRVFKDMEMLKITSHTASSMNTRYRKCILPNIDNYKYDVDPRWLTRLTGGVPVKDKEPTFSVDALFNSRRNKDTVSVRNNSPKKHSKTDRLPSANEVDKSSEACSRNADLTKSKYWTDKSSDGAQKVGVENNASLLYKQMLHKRGVIDQCDTVTETSSSRSWHTAEENLTAADKTPTPKRARVVLNRVDSPHAEKHDVYEYHSQADSSCTFQTCDTNQNANDVDDSLKILSTCDGKDNVSNGSAGSKSVSDIIDWLDQGETALRKEANDNNVHKIDRQFVGKRKRRVDSDDHVSDNAETQPPDMEEVEESQSVCNKTSDNVSKGNQQIEDSDTQRSIPSQVSCNTISSSSDVIVSSLNSMEVDSYDKLLLGDYEDTDKCSDKDKSVEIPDQHSGTPESDSFDRQLKDFVSDTENSVKGKPGDDKTVNSGGAKTRSQLRKANPTNKQGDTPDDTVSAKERSEIDRCNTICKELSGKYDLSFDFVVQLLMQCNGHPQRLEAYIMYGPHSPMLPPWTIEDDALLTKDPEAVQLIRKYGDNDVLYRQKYLTD